LLSNSKVRDVDAVRLVMLYAVRYEKHTNNDISGLIGALQRRNLPDRLIRVTNCPVIQTHAIRLAHRHSITRRLTF